MIGTYPVIFNRRTEFLFQTFTVVKGQAIRKEKWLKCFDGKPELKLMFERAAQFFYIRNIKRPAFSKKMKYLQKLNQRSDWEIMKVARYQDENLARTLDTSKMVLSYFGDFVKKKKKTNVDIEYEDLETDIDKNLDRQDKVMRLLSEKAERTANLSLMLHQKVELNESKIKALKDRAVELMEELKNKQE